MVAVSVYPSVATEHWGLVTFRESHLLYDEHQLNDFVKQRHVSIIAHELAHNVRCLSRLLPTHYFRFFSIAHLLRHTSPSVQHCQDVVIAHNLTMQ